MPAQRMSTSSRNETSGIGPRTSQSLRSACASSSTRSTMRSMRASSSNATSSSGASPSSRRSSSSRWPRAIVTGVRSSWDTLWSSCSSCSRSDARSSASASTVASAWVRRRACHTIARNIADISGTSNSSPHSWMPSKASARIDAPVHERDGPEDSAGRREAPDAEPVEQRQADPDDVERDRLPGRRHHHQKDAAGGERGPAELEEVRPWPADSPHVAPSRSARLVRASCAGGGRTRRRRSSPGSNE